MFGIYGGKGVKASYNNVWHNNNDYYAEAAAASTDISKDTQYVSYWDYVLKLQDASPCKTASGTGGEIGAYGNGGNPPTTGLTYSTTPTTSGSLTKNERWSGTVNLTDSVNVPNPFVLKIEPGTVINIPKGVGIYSSGLFYAEGTPSQPIVFQWAKEGEYWGNISLNTPGSNLSYCRVIGGGYSNSYGAVSANSSPTIRNNVIAQSYGTGIDISGSPVIENNVITDNKSAGIFIHSASSKASVRFNTIDSNYTGISFYNTSSDYQNVVVENNIISNNMFGIYGGKGVKASYNNVWHNNNDYYAEAAAASTDISSDPKYIDGLRHLSDSSPSKKASSTGGEIGAYGKSEGPTSAITPPLLISPENNATITSPNTQFSWSHPFNDQYKLTIEGVFESNKTSSKSLMVNLREISLEDLKTYKWYVTVYANNLEAVSEKRSFTYKKAQNITPPTLVSPENNVVITSSTSDFSWSHNFNDQYILRIENASGVKIYESDKLSAKSATVNLLNIPLKNDETYKWYVTVYANNLEDVSEKRSFTYKKAQGQGITPPTLVSPADNAEIKETSFTFSWSHQFSDDYELIIIDGNTKVLSSGQIKEKSYKASLSGLTSGKTYKWYVVVYANDKNVSSEERIFTYKASQSSQVNVREDAKAVPKKAPVESKEGVLDGANSFDPALPVTTILVHGWNTDINLKSLDKVDWIVKMKSLLSQSNKTNILAYNWLDEAAKDNPLPTSQDRISQHGKFLADLLKKLFAEKGNYKGKIHLIGHSAGGGVSYNAANALVDRGIPVDHLTLTDAYFFDGDKALSELKKPSNWYELSVDITHLVDIDITPSVAIGKAVSSAMHYMPLSKADFIDNYWTTVGGLSQVFTILPAISITYKGTGAFIADSASVVLSDSAAIFALFSLEDRVKDTSYFTTYKGIGGYVADVLHATPVNWYMASMVDQLQIAKYSPSANYQKHQYGYYWSPVFPDHSRPAKADLDFLLGIENYFNLFGSSEILHDLKNLSIEVGLEIKQGAETVIQKGKDLNNRLKKSAEELKTKIKVVAADTFDSASNWVASKSLNVIHNITDGYNYFWMKSDSPVSLATDYAIPADAPFMAFSYKVLQADGIDVIDVFVNDEMVYSRTAADDLNKDIVLSAWINVAKWAGQTVLLTFRIYSADGEPIIIELYDLVFAQIGDIEKVINLDSDKDGIPDLWEAVYLGNTNQDGTGDADGDGIRDIDEYRNGTDPLKAESISKDITSSITANAGADMTVSERNTVTLNGSSSTGAVSYQWTMLGKAPDWIETPKLSDPNSPNPTFTAPEVGVDGGSMVFQLTVTDSTGRQSSDVCDLKILNIDSDLDDGKNGKSCFISAAGDVPVRKGFWLLGVFAVFVFLARKTQRNQR